MKHVKEVRYIIITMSYSVKLPPKNYFTKHKRNVFSNKKMDIICTTRVCDCFGHFVLRLWTWLVYGKQ